MNRPVKSRVYYPGGRVVERVHWEVAQNEVMSELDRPNLGKRCTAPYVDSRKGRNGEPCYSVVVKRGDSTFRTAVGFTYEEAKAAADGELGARMYSLAMSGYLPPMARVMVDHELARDLYKARPSPFAARSQGWWGHRYG